MKPLYGAALKAHTARRIRVLNDDTPLYRAVCTERRVWPHDGSRFASAGVIDEDTLDDDASHAAEERRHQGAWYDLAEDDRADLPVMGG